MQNLLFEHCVIKVYFVCYTRFETKFYKPQVFCSIHFKFCFKFVLNSTWTTTKWLAVTFALSTFIMVCFQLFDIKFQEIYPKPKSKMFTCANVKFKFTITNDTFLL